MKPWILILAIGAALAGCDRTASSGQTANEGKAVQSAAGATANEGKAARSATGGR